jgi:hypothetical protein
MSCIQTPLPEKSVKLKSIISSLNNTCDDLEHRLRVEVSHNRLLREQIRFYKQRLFGRKNEVLRSESVDQTQLFNKAAVVAEEKKTEADELVQVPTHQRKKRGRKPLPDDLPREEVIHDLPEKEEYKSNEVFELLKKQAKLRSNNNEIYYNNNYISNFIGTGGNVFCI